ncbi:MAG: methyltransferase [Phycisphaerales bacterium]|nr:MAG: methyltransferase [Phycisphaerales bacterium]
MLRETVSVEHVRQALRPMTLQQWIEAGIVHPPTSEGRVRSAVRFTPVQGFLLAADCPQLDAIQAPIDFVMPPGGTSLQLGWSAIRRSARRTLDLGTGCGYLGLVASVFSNLVVATDYNERAVAVARFNALLNGITRMETRVGDLWDPIRGERFDLVLSNPPFVITPQRRLLLRDSGIRGDEFCRRLIREVPSYLEEGGFCQMLGNFAHLRDRPWQEDLSAWFTDLGCDAVVFVTRRQPIDEYAMTWITATESQDVAVVPRMFNEWMEYYERQQIEQVSYLLINLRRRSGISNQIYVDEEEVRIAGECGDSIQTRFALLDYLAELPSDAALLDECLMLDPNARLVQEHVMSAAGPKLVENRLEMRGALRHSARLDTNVMRFLVYCDRQQPLRAILTGLADSLGLEPDRVCQITLPTVRHMIERGFLIPARFLSSSSRD